MCSKKHVFPNAKLWMTGHVWMLVRACDVAFKSATVQPASNMKRGINKAKVNYKKLKRPTPTTTIHGWYGKEYRVFTTTKVIWDTQWFRHSFMSEPHLCIL